MRHGLAVLISFHGLAVHSVHTMLPYTNSRQRTTLCHCIPGKPHVYIYGSFVMNCYKRGWRLLAMLRDDRSPWSLLTRHLCACVVYLCMHVLYVCILSYCYSAVFTMALWCDMDPHAIPNSNPEMVWLHFSSTECSTYLSKAYGVLYEHSQYQAGST